MPGSGTGQLKYQEVVVDPADHTGCVPDAGCPAISDRGSLVVSFDEGGLKSLASVDYRLDASVTAFGTCVDTGETIGTKYSASNTVAGLVPDDKGHVLGSIELAVGGFGGLPSICAGFLLLQITYTNVTLTNLTSSEVYRLDSIGRTFP